MVKMMVYRNAKVLLLALFAIVVASTNGFVVQNGLAASRTLAQRHSPQEQHRTSSSAHHLNARTAVSTTRLYEGKKRSSIDGVDVAPGILAFAVLLSVWQFTIPPNFRRTRFCATAADVAERVNNCVTTEEYTTGIANYYKGGGGIKWDFSIDPETLATNEDIKDVIAVNSRRLFK
jgi:hypothetical protein